MKVLIVSDSHGLVEELADVRQQHTDADVLIHCGDSELPSDHGALQSFHYVRGNCDFDARFPNAISQELAGYKFFITHGHLYNVKMTLLGLGYKAEEESAQIVCFGHSHIAGSEMIDGRLFINPGSIRLPKGINEKTYAVLEICDREVKVEFFNLERKKIDRLTKTYHFE